MWFRFKLQGDDSPEIQILRPFWAGIKAFVNGVEVQRLKEKGKPF